MRISDWSSDVCSSDLSPAHSEDGKHAVVRIHRIDVGGARVILASEIAIARKEGRSGFGNQPHRGHGFLNELEIKCIIGETGRLDQANLVPRTKSRRLSRG